MIHTAFARRSRRNPLRSLARLLLISAAALALGTTAKAQAPDETFDLLNESATGSFLAGQHALADLDTAEAAEFLNTAALAEWENPQVVERSFFAFLADGQIDQAASTAKHLLDLIPNNELAQLVIATQSVKQRRYQSAEQILEPLGTDNFAGITGGILRAWAYVGNGKPDEAAAVLDQLSTGGLEGFLVLHRAMMAEVEGNTEDAVKFAGTAYNTEPQVARLVEAYARILGNAGRFDEAMAVIAQFESQGLSHSLVDVVKTKLAQKQSPGPFITSVQAGAAEMFHGVGIALARDGGADLAVAFLRLALYLEPESDVVKLALGQLLDISNQHDLANAIYNQVPEGSPMKPTAVIRVSQNLDAMGDRTEAIRQLSNIVATRPADTDAASVLGDLLREEERYPEATAAYTKVLDAAPGDRPTDWRFYYVRAISYERDKRWPEAEKDFLRALELNPDQPQVLNYLGYSWVDKGMNYDQALGMIEKAVEASPGDGYIVDSLGWAFYKLGRMEEAVRTLEQAVQLRPNDPEINDHLGDAYWKVGRKQEARFQWTVAGSQDETGAVKERVAPKLANGLPADGVAPAAAIAPTAETQAVTP